MLKLKKSAKESKRYLLIESSKSLIEKAILDYVGILGWARSAPYFVKKDGGKQILKINSKEINDIRAALALSADKIKVLKVSGTLKGLRVR